MKKTTKALAPVIGMLFAVSTPALAHQTAPKVFVGGTGATTSAVNIFQPTLSRPPVDSAEEPRIIVLNKTIVNNVFTPEHETRAERRKRALGHRYLGFKKQYSGYKYPF